MLYDKRWDAKIEQKANAAPYTLASLIEWLETREPEQVYNFSCRDGSCLLDSYITSITNKPSRPTKLHWEICGGATRYGQIAAALPWTYGAALERARAAQH